MNVVRCSWCGESIRPEGIDERSHVALCTACGALSPMDGSVFELRAVRELLQQPPERATVMERNDGGKRVVLKPPAGTKGLGLMLVMLLPPVALAVLMPFCTVYVGDWLVDHGMDGNSLSAVGGIVLAFLACVSIMSFIAAVPLFLVRTSTWRIDFHPEYVSLRAFYLGVIPSVFRTVVRCSPWAECGLKFLPMTFRRRKSVQKFTAQVTLYEPWKKERVVFSSRDVLVVQYVRALLMEWLGRTGVPEGFVCRVCGTEVPSDRVDMAARMIACPACGQTSSLEVADVYRCAVRTLKAPPPEGISILPDSEHARGFVVRVGNRWIWPFLRLTLVSLVVAGRFYAEAPDSRLTLALIGGAAVCLSLFVLQVLLRLFRKARVTLEENAVRCQVRGLFRRREIQIGIGPKSLAVPVRGRPDAVGIVIDRDENGGEILLADLSPSCREWAGCWLNCQLLRIRPEEAEKEREN